MRGVDLFLPRIGVVRGLEDGAFALHAGELAVVDADHVENAQHFEKAHVLVRDMHQAEPSVAVFHLRGETDEGPHEGGVHALAVPEIDHEVAESGAQLRLHQSLERGGEEHVAEAKDLNQNRILGPGDAQTVAHAGLGWGAGHLARPFFQRESGEEFFVHVGIPCIQKPYRQAQLYGLGFRL